MTVNADEPAVLFHLHLSDASPVEEQEISLADGSKAKVLWKDVLVEGEYPMSPSAAGATNEPMRVITDGDSDPKTKTISMSDIEFAHEDAAFKYVTIPTSHRDGLLDNTGYVPRPKGLRRVEKHGKQVLQAALGFTEPDIKGKVSRGTIPDVSAGIFFSWTNKHTKKKYPAALKHVALTPTPFMGNLDPFPAIFASDDELADDTKVEVYELSDDTSAAMHFESGDSGSSDSTGDNKVEIVWNEIKSANFIRSAVEEQLRPPEPRGDVPYVPQPSYYVQDVSVDDSTALVQEYFKGESKRFIIPFTRDDDGKVAIAPALRWTEAREAMVAASDNFDDMSATTVMEKLGLALSEQLGQTGLVYRVKDVTFDKRAHVTCNVKGEWFARFAMFADGSVWLEPADQWEAINKPSDKKTPTPVKQPSGVSNGVALSDDIEARVQAARQHRRQLLAS